MGGQATRRRESDSQASEPLRFDVAVGEGHVIELRVPYAPGEKVVVYVVRLQDDPREDLAAAASSTLAFWDNAYDDEDWGSR